MKKQNIVRGITLGLVLGTSLIGAVAYANTPITDGTHSVGGDVTLTDIYVNANSNANVVINVTGDTAFTQTASEQYLYRLGGSVNNTNILVNGNNKDVIADGNGHFAFMDKDSSNNSIKIANINNLTINNTLTTDGNDFYVRGANNYLSIDVNNDMNFINYSKLPFFVCQEVGLYTNVIDFKAGHDINISGTSNLISNKFNSTINLEAGNDIVINGTSETTPPILAYDGATENYKAKHDFIINSLTASFAINNNSTGTVTVENDIKISSLNATGISVITNGIGNFTANGDIIVNAKSTPISVQSGAKGTFIAGNNINLTSAGTSSGMVVYGDNSEALLEAKNGDFIMQSTNGNSSTIYTSGKSKTKITAGKAVVIGGNARYAIYAQGGSKFDVTAGEGYAIDVLATNTSGTNNIGVISQGSGTEVNFYSPTNISAVTSGIYASAGTINFTKEANISGAQTGITARNMGTVSVAGDAKIAATQTGVEANNGTISLAKDTVISGAPTGVNSHDNGNITFAKNLTITGADTAITVQSGGVVNATDPDSAKKITGNILVDGAGSAANLVLNTADSYITGSSARTSGGIISLNMKKKALWNVTADSSVSDLDMEDATINMRYTGNSSNETLTADNLSGNGNFIMNTDLQSSFDSKDVTTNGDKIVITTSSSGDNILDLRDISLDTGKLAEGYLLLVEDQSNGAATFSGKDLDHGGIFKYKPVIVTDNPTDYTGFNAAAKNWYLTGFEKTVAVSDNTNVSLGMADTRYANYLMDTDTLLKRLGELRMLKAEEDRDGLWARYRHGGMNGEKFDGSFSTFQIGYDKKTSQKRYTGLAYSHTSNSFDLNAGKGEGSMDAISVYNTWLGDKNHYFDIVGKIGRMRGNSTYQDALFPEKGDYESKFYSLSGEYGRKNINKNGYYYEPQAQLTLGRISGDDYTTSRGTKVSAKSITSLLGRAGVTIGKEYDMDNPAKHSNVYAKVNYLHEFKGDSTTNLTDAYGDSFGPTTDFGGSWWNLGIGTTVNLNKETHLYVDLEKNFGGEVKTNWLMQAGVRWTW